MPDTSGHALPPIGPCAPWLAPLAGYSDLPFRLLCREYGAACACTEMVSAKGYIYRSPGTEPLLATCPEDSPLVLQLYGAEKGFVLQAARELNDRGYQLFDFNAGCSVRKVVKTGAGAALLRGKEARNNLVDMIAGLVDLAGPGRVGVKYRLGWDKGDACWLELGRDLEQAGAGWLTLHPRFAAQGFSGLADREALVRLKQAVNIPVMASGDLFTARDGADCLRQTGVDGVMFARGAMADPAVFRKYLALVNGDEPLVQDPRAVLDMARRHVDLVMEHGGEKPAMLKMRTFIPRYIKGLPGARPLRKELCLCSSWTEFEKLLEAFLANCNQKESLENA